MGNDEANIDINKLRVGSLKNEVAIVKHNSNNSKAVVFACEKVVKPLEKKNDHII
ncbi:5842_t:CDS:2 [Gigaspora margarita]|uniref:5842_t:CDS:1 n=1 Tax=Gigaspora margarita TaxID=4874 RepID=A0ABM8VW72_GIGMA|nr:5842_t:CDS:2 [Gigaspora margarita]